MSCPLHYDSSQKGYYYDDETFSLPMVYLSSGEVASLLIARKMLQDISGGFIGEEISSIVDKITNVLSKHMSMGDHIDDTFSFQLIEYSPGLLTFGQFDLESHCNVTCDLILDFDLHYEDGTSNTFSASKSVSYFHPEGTRREGFLEEVKQRLQAERPIDIIAISAGFDHHEEDWRGVSSRPKTISPWESGPKSSLWIDAKADGCRPRRRL